MKCNALQPLALRSGVVEQRLWLSLGAPKIFALNLCPQPTVTFPTPPTLAEMDSTSSSHEVIAALNNHQGIADPSPSSSDPILLLRSPVTERLSPS